MLSIQEYESKIEILKTSLKELYEQMERAGIASKGDYQNKIKIEVANLGFYQKELDKIKKAKTPDQINIQFYILVTTKSQVSNHLGEVLFNLFEEEHYHESDATLWKPYKAESSIDELLKDLTKRYNFTHKFIETNTIDDEFWVQIDNEINQSIAIIDLFSLNDENKSIAQKFDTEKAGGVLLPLCTTLMQELKEFAVRCQDCFRVVAAKRRKYIPCELFFADIGTVNRLQDDIMRILLKKFPIKNQSSHSTDVRGLNIGF